jgi:hypothetical protein
MPSLQIMEIIVMYCSFLHFFVTSGHLGPYILLSTLLYNTPTVSVEPLMFLIQYNGKWYFYMQNPN